MPISKPASEPSAGPRRGPSLKRFSVFVLTAWFLLMLIQARDPDSVEASIAPAATRKEATFADFPLVDGGTWRLNDYRGKVVLVNLWATWCPPCRAETPDLVRLASELKSEGLEVVGVSMDQGESDPIRRFAQQYAVPYPLARGIGERSFSLGVPLPTTCVYDRSGKLAITAVGAIEGESFRELLKRLLREST